MSYFKHITISKYKNIEIQASDIKPIDKPKPSLRLGKMGLYASAGFFEVNFRRSTDHPGLWISFFSRDKVYTIDVYDTRHWCDTENRYYRICTVCGASEDSVMWLKENKGKVCIERCKYEY